MDAATRSLLQNALDKNLLWGSSEYERVRRILEDNLYEYEDLFIEDLCKELNKLTFDYKEHHRNFKEILYEYLEKVNLEARKYIINTIDVNLEDVYINLEVGDKTLLNMISDNSRIVVLGESGSGKSTLIAYLVIMLSSVLLKEKDIELRKNNSWYYVRPHIPILVNLKQFAIWLQKYQSSNIHDSHILWDYIRDKYGVHDNLRSCLLEIYQKYGAILFFDGLDELSTDPTFKRVISIIESVSSYSNICKRTHIVVTCRTYFKDNLSNLANWKSIEIYPLSIDEQKELINKWYHIIYQENNLISVEPEIINFVKDIENQTTINYMTSNPLLLSMMIQDTNSKSLSYSIHDLYKSYLNRFLEDDESNNYHVLLKEKLEIPTWSSKDIKNVLIYLAYSLYMTGVNQSNEIIINSLEKETRRYFKRYEDKEYLGSVGRADIFLHFMNQHSKGIIRKVGSETFVFAHHIFQEYFAALCLINKDNDWHDEPSELSLRMLAVEYSHSWKQVLKLAIHILKSEGGIKTAARALKDILEDCEQQTESGGKAALLVGELLLELGIKEIVDIKRCEHLPQILVEQHLLPLYDLASDTVSVKTKLQATLLLNRYGDPRPGVTTLEPRWIEIPEIPKNPENSFLYSGRNSQPTTLIDYHISCYPVTNAQFRMFIEDDGYHNEQFWTPAGWQMVDQLPKEWLAPRSWNDGRFNNPNQPVVGVSWYEAVAYCNWLSHKLGYEIRLPTDAEWEKAAVGEMSKNYPWGDEWDHTRANMESLDLKQTTPVGMFPNGRSPYDIDDMVGNVWEWTSSDYDNLDQVVPSKVENINDQVKLSIRGGAWNYNFTGETILGETISPRTTSAPNARTSSQGFRVVTTGQSHLNGCIVSLHPA